MANRLLGPLLLLVALAACAEGTQGAGIGGGGAVSGVGGAGPASGGGGPAGAGAGSPASSGASSGGGEGGGGGPTSASSSSASSSSTSASTGASSSSSSGAGGAPGALFFSEYVEGEGNDKAVEIVNGGPTPFDLGSCVIDRYQNGASSPAAPAIALSGGQLAPGAVHVVCNDGFSAAGACDQLDQNLQHSGDDALELVCEGATKDVFGRIGEQEVWGSPPTTSRDAVLRRKCSVSEGDPNGGDAFDPAIEWDGFPLDDFSGLGAWGCP